MQIHVQNAPFVYNPDTISVGLGFSKGEKKMTVGIQYIKNISQCCVQFVVVFFISPAAFIYYITSKSRPLKRETAKGGVLQEKCN